MTLNRIDFEDIKQILDQEIELHQQIEHYLSEKRDIIVRGDLDALMNVDNQIEQLVQQGKQLEEHRLAIMIKLGRSSETLKQFIASLESGDDTKMLNQAREKLAKVTTNIQSLSQSNRDLLTYSIHLVEQSVNFIASILAPQGASYSSTPKIRPTIGNQSTENVGGLASTVSHEA